MRKQYKIMTAVLLSAGLLAGAAAVPALASKKSAGVVRGEYDFSDMSVRRVWFNTSDPVFLMDDYDRIWLDPDYNVVADGDYKDTGSTGTLMAPMAEMFRQIGVGYKEDGEKIIITMNGDTLILTIGKKDIVWNGENEKDTLSELQVPKLVSVRDSNLNPYLKGDHKIVYLPVTFVLNKFQAELHVDSSIESLYAAVPVFRTKQTPDLERIQDEYGINYRGILGGKADINPSVVKNVLSIQNRDGGFALLPEDTDMSQENLSEKRGSLTSDSTLEKGATTSELNYLSDSLSQISDKQTTEAITDGIRFLLDHQDKSGGWQMNPGNPGGFRENIVFTDHITTDVLRLLRRMDTDMSLQKIKDKIGSDVIEQAVKAGDAFILQSQIQNDGKKSGWASQYTSDGKVTMGRTYERESISAIETADITEYLMEFYPSDSKPVKEAVDSAVNWLQDVKIEDKEAVRIPDDSMQNGFDLFLLDGTEPGVVDHDFVSDGLGTWAANYIYENGGYRPLYADVDPKRPDQPEVNNWNAKTSDQLIWYATRSTVVYYDNDLADTLIGETYPAWSNRQTSSIEDVINKYLKNEQLNQNLADQLLYRVSVIRQLEDQGQNSTAVDYIKDLVTYIKAPSVIQQGLITEEAVQEIETICREWSESINH